jgi:hypothetical protein
VRENTYAQYPAAARCGYRATLLQPQQGHRRQCYSRTAKNKTTIENRKFNATSRKIRNAQGTASPQCCWFAWRLRCNERRRRRSRCSPAKKLRFSGVQKIKHNRNKTEKERAAELRNRSQRTSHSSFTVLLVRMASAMQRAPSAPKSLRLCKKTAVQWSSENKTQQK